MKRGVPPTERKARTGELTPPGIVLEARAKSSELRDMSCSKEMGWRRARPTPEKDSVEVGGAATGGFSDVGREEDAADHRDAVGARRDDGRGVFGRDAADGDHRGPGAFEGLANDAAGFAQVLRLRAHRVRFHVGREHGAKG